jgi:hypothetical protein
MAVLFLAPSGAFIGSDLSMGPDVYPVGGWIDDRVPCLGDLVRVPFAEGVVKFTFPGSRVTAAEYLPPHGPDGGQMGFLGEGSGKLVFVGCLGH